MTVFNLLTFPNVCRACLQSLHPEQMVPLDTYRPQLEQDIGSFLEDISFAASKAIVPYLPSTICFPCLDVMELYSKYRRKMKHLHSFLEALVHVKLGDDMPLREQFLDRTEQLEMLFGDLDLCNKTGAGVDDLLQEFGQYTLASMHDGSASEPTSMSPKLDDPDEPAEGQYSNRTSDDEIAQTTPVPATKQSKPPSVAIKRKPLSLKIEFKSLAPTTGSAAPSDDDEELGDQRTKSEGKRLLCTQCTFKTNYTVSFNMHVEKHKRNEGKPGYTCKNPFCMQLFATPDELKAHRKTANVHTQYTCDICGTVLKHRYSLEVHMERHTGITQVPCKYCSSSFYTKTELQNHIAAIHITEDRAECLQCGAFFTSNKLLKQHMISHVEQRNYHCPECSKSFKSQHHLNRHINHVHNEVRFKCEHCGKSYSRRDKMRLHVENVHRIQTYFVCNICVRSFDNEAQLQEHEHHHTHPQDLECATCLLVFLTTESFDKHTCITYQDDYVCCGRDFKYHMLYNKHMMAHGIKVNARVRPKSHMLIGQERAIREAKGGQYSMERVRSTGTRSRKRKKSNSFECVQCKQTFDTDDEQAQHSCKAPAVDSNVEILHNTITMFDVEIDADKSPS